MTSSAVKAAPCNAIRLFYWLRQDRKGMTDADIRHPYQCQNIHRLPDISTRRGQYNHQASSSPQLLLQQVRNALAAQRSSGPANH
jgi:hypothetical protein